MIIQKKNLISKMEVWFEDQLLDEPSGVDVVYYYFQKKIPPAQRIQVSDAYTILIDLRKDEDILWKNIDRSTRREINRAAQRDEVKYEFLNSLDQDILDQFSDFYDQFASDQGLPLIDRDRFKRYRDAGILNISCVKSKHEEVLSWHSLIVCNGRAYGLHSSAHRNTEDSSYKNMIARVNRYHHWQDILKFKTLGLTTFDFGGWYSGCTNQKLLNTNRFKEKFGGEIVQEFNCRYGVTLKGELFLLMRSMSMSLTHVIERVKYRLSQTS